ncbi:tRNA (uracil-O(2)-)-methyltransferase [Paecilomyces variotii No. 5]|uniref:tRNA (uracil-O(2)-)-methyltransferase n=1 Tax=Byssochlamys spectabilis (strain No. 5 / NBRC 109023) TaxID=1356009 RepID=V5G375_BYSSN|nr:tRNA (uracil-O(2)-)-methyltransferase [Paecilomyces variotii No. 5]
MVRSKRKVAQDPSSLSGKPLSETLTPSPLKFQEEGWVTSPDLIREGLPFAPQVMYKLTTFLLGNPNKNSTHLFRADILFDSEGRLKTPQEKELSFAQNQGADTDTQDVEPLPAAEVSGFYLTRSVVRRFIPRNPQLDRALEQTCHFYAGSVKGTLDATGDNEEPELDRVLFVYTPHISSKDDLPWYHPLLRSLAFLYDFKRDSTVVETKEAAGSGSLSIHFLPFSLSEESIPTRLERTLQALIATQIRLARSTRSADTPEGGNYNPTKDNVLPQHRIQNTYSRLKVKYGSYLCENWVEETDPSKHVFEDLAITAFLIELWRSMYGVAPEAEKDSKSSEDTTNEFPGFVDVACGNGVLVYILIMEGYKGWGFDARRRKTWSIFPGSVQDCLKESIYIPKPFVDTMIARGESEVLNIGVSTHNGIFPKDTFIISNHADELTAWTPLMAALSQPESPLPFLAIPCCSHSLSGARFRYPPPKTGKKDRRTTPDEEVEQDAQPASGDLKALRASKMEEKTDAGILKSMYGSLTAKTMSIAEEVGYEVEKTLLRIPSTRNMGVIGGRLHVQQRWDKSQNVEEEQFGDVVEGVMMVVQRECLREGGIEVAARIWIERAKGLNKGQGKGNHHGKSQ